MIGIVCFLSTRYAQFAYKYINVLEKNKIPYEFIFWNREGDYNEEKDNWIPFDENINSFQPFYKKIFSFIKFSIFMRKKIKERKYDKLIVLISQTAIPLTDLLLFKYKKKYIYDYRDVTFENIKLYKMLINKLVKNSCFTAISSKGFMKYLDSDNTYVLSHNTRNFELLNIDKNNSSKIRIVYWGMVRQLDFNCKICDLFANDDRFEIYYHGAGYHNELKEYCKEKKYENIIITGSYNLENIKEFVKNTDIILNLYDNDKQQMPAMTVKFYDSIMYGKPMLVNKYSYMSQLVNEYNLGFIFDEKDNFILDKLYEQYTQFNYCNYEVMRKEIYELIKEDDIRFEKKLINTIKGVNTNERSEN